MSKVALSSYTALALIKSKGDEMRYSFGHAAVWLASLIGGLSMIGSVITAIIFLFISDNEQGYSVAIAFAGIFYGVLLIGVGSIGKAILDGAVSQQNSEAILGDIKILLSSQTTTQQDTSNPIKIPSNGKEFVMRGDPDKFRSDSFMGEVIKNYYTTGEHVVRGMSFLSREEATSYVKELRRY